MNEWDQAVQEAEKIFGKKFEYFTDDELEYCNKIFNNLSNFQESKMTIKKTKGLAQRFLESNISAAKFLDIEYKRMKEDLASGGVQTTSDTPELTKPLMTDEKDKDDLDIINISNPDQVLKEEEIETLSDDNGENLSPSDKESILNGEQPEGFENTEFKEDTEITSHEDIESMTDEMNNGENLSPSDKQEILNGNEPIGFEDTEFKEDMVYDDDLVPVDNEIEQFPVESQIVMENGVCPECGLEDEFCVCDGYEDDETLEEYGYISDDEMEFSECGKLQEDTYPAEMVNYNIETKALNEKKNSIPVKGTWEEIKSFISKNYTNYTTVIFVNPDTGKESAIDLKKVGLNFIVNCEAEDIGKLAMRESYEEFPGHVLNSEDDVRIIRKEKDGKFRVSDNNDRNEIIGLTSKEVFDKIVKTGFRGEIYFETGDFQLETLRKGV